MWKMKTADPARKRLAAQIDCRELPPFDVSDLPSVHAAFRNAQACALRQAWLTEHESEFTPGIVRMGWRKNSFLLFAELADAHIFTRATRHHQRFWELGDTFEIFLRPMQQESYAEIHITPNNLRLHLHFAGIEAAKQTQVTGSFESVLVREKKFDSRTWVQPEVDRWLVFVEISAGSICKSPDDLSGSRWLFSFSRYDYVRGRKEPVISSTSAHAKPDFHCQEEWGELLFVNGSKDEKLWA